MAKSLKRLLAITLSFVIVLGTVAIGGGSISDLLSLKASAGGTAYSAGDIITLGKYEQDNSTENGKEDIEWIVLDSSTGLCVSRYALDVMAFDDDSTDYSGSEIRAGLYGADGNSGFYTDAFTDSEKSAILQENVVTYSYGSSTEISSTLTDKVFLLSTEEANKYFADDASRICSPTAYAAANGAGVDGSTGGCYWWLRSPGSYISCAAMVYGGGSVCDTGIMVTIPICVRPALYLNLESGIFKSEITLNANNGTDETEKQSAYYNFSYYPDCPFTNGTKTFFGWYKDAECTERWSKNDIVTGDMTLYAGWSEYKAGDVITFGKYEQDNNT